MNYQISIARIKINLIKKMEMELAFIRLKILFFFSHHRHRQHHNNHHQYINYINHDLTKSI